MQLRVQHLWKWLFSWKMQSTLWSGILVAVLGAWFTHWIGPGSSPVQFVPIPVEKQSPDVKPSLDHQTDVAKLVQESRISFADWQQLVKAVLPEEKRMQILENYRGERVSWQGVVDQINEIPRENGGNATNRYLMVMYEDRQTKVATELGRAPALCIFPANSQDDLQQISPGQEITLQGTLAAPETLHGTLLGTRLYNCKLLR
jgi:hypothetical protein